MTRETSRKAYMELVESGRLKGQLATILAMVIASEPATAAEIVKDTTYAKNLNCTRARFTELQERGLIREVGQRRCSVTGRDALVWMFTGRTVPLADKRKRVSGAKEWKALAKALYVEGKAIASKSGQFQRWTDGVGGDFVRAYGGEP